MDFSVLSRYDDILADYFVDNLYLWYNTLRMNGDFVGTDVDKNQAVKLLREHVVAGQTTQAALKSAVEAFLTTSYFQEYTKNFESKQLTEFGQHMKRYLIMYRHSAGFEVGSTTRYTGKPEACLIATKMWNAGEQVTCCLGSIAALSEQDDLKLKSEGRDFSVMVSTRKKCSCLFLGPARFMNHDCDSNCEFILIGQNAITFRVIKDIMIGEEMTVFYADHYFGEDNCECMCVSCERTQEGHFSSLKDTTSSPNDSDAEQNIQNDNSGSRRSGRKRKEISYKDYYVPEQVKRAKHLPPESNSKANVKPMIEITNVVSKDNTVEQRNTANDRQWRQKKLDDILHQRQINFGIHQSPNKVVYGGFNNQLQRAVSAPPRFNFTNHTSAEYMDIARSYRDKGTRSDMEMEMFKEWLDNLSELSDEESSDSSQITKNLQLTCCGDWKEYYMSRISEEPDLCGRCNRHYQIYGIQWPIRRLKPITTRVKNKGMLAIEAPPSPPASLEKATVPSVLPKKSPRPSAPPIRYKVAVRLAGENGPKLIKPKPIAPSAASYDTDPIIINARNSYLSIPTIHNSNLPVQDKILETALVLEMQDRLSLNKPFKRSSITPYKPICLDADISDRQNQILRLLERRRSLAQLRARLHQSTNIQKHNAHRSVNTQYIPTLEVSSPHADDRRKFDSDRNTEVEDTQCESCKFQKEEVESDYSIDVVCYEEEIKNVEETLSCLDEHNDTDSPASITTPIYTCTPDERKRNHESSKQRESLLLSEESRPINMAESSIAPATPNYKEKHRFTAEVVDLDAIQHESSTSLALPIDCKVDFVIGGHKLDTTAINEGKKDESSCSVSKEISETTDKMVLLNISEEDQEKQCKLIAWEEEMKSVNFTEVVNNEKRIIAVHDPNDMQKCPPLEVHVDLKALESDTSNKQQVESVPSPVKKASVENASTHHSPQSPGATSRFLTQAEVTPTIESFVNFHEEDVSLLRGDKMEEDVALSDIPITINRCHSELEPSSIIDPIFTQVKCEDTNGQSNVDNLINEVPILSQGLSSTGETEIDDPPSPTFTEILEYAVSPKNISLEDPHPIEAIEETPVVKQEVVEEAPYSISRGGLRPRRAKKAVLEKKGELSEFGAVDSSETIDTSVSLDIESIVNSKKPICHTSLIPDLCNILNQPSASETQSSLDFLALVDNDYRTTLQYQMQERYSLMNAIAELRNGKPEVACGSYYATSQTLQHTTTDHSYSVPSFESIVNQSHYNSNSSNSHSSYSSVEDVHAVKKEYDDAEIYRNLLRSATERNSALANKEKLRHQLNGESSKQQDHYIESFSDYPALPSFQAIVNHDCSQHLYPLADEYRSVYTEPGYIASPTPTSTVLAVASLLSREQKQSDTTIPQAIHIPNYDTQERSGEPMNPPQHRSTVSTTHFSSRPSDALSPSPVPQQPPMKVSFLLQTDIDEDNAEKNKTIPGIDRPMTRASARKHDNVESAKKPAATKRVTKATPKKSTPKRTSSRATTPSASKKEARVGCPIAPPQRDPPLSAEMVKKSLKLKRFHGIDLLNPFVPRNTPAPSSLSAQYNNRSSTPYIPNAPNC
ncbi:unnamed protein product [Mucor hiemalis]